MSNKFRVEDLVERSSTIVDLVGFTPNPLNAEHTYEIESFYAGYSATSAGASGGGKFVWVASAAKSLHDGALYISPTVPWDGTSATLAAWQNKTGETQPAGTGCWRRVHSQGKFNAAWWGTIGNDPSVNNQPMLQKCFVRANAIGGKRKIIIPSQGILYVAGITNYYGNEVIEGEAGATIKQNSPSLNPIFFRSGNSGPSWVDYVVFRNLTLVGYWETIQDGYTVANGLLTGTYIRNVRVENCDLSYSRFMSLNFNNCDTVKVVNNTIKYSARDMIAVWNTPNVYIAGNTLDSNDDDGISVSSNPTSGNTRTKVIVTGNHLSSTGAIRAVGGRGIKIFGNTIDRPTGNAIMMLTGRPDTYMSSTQSCSILNNTITNVIDRNYFVDGTASSAQLRTAIVVDSIPTNNGGTGIVPGEIDPATGQTVEPYSQYYSTSGASNTSKVRASSGVRVAGNIVKRTLPAVSNYSDWGFGQAFTLSGFVDYPVTDSHMDAVGIDIRLPMYNCVVEGNQLETSGRGVLVSLASGVTQTDFLARGLIIRNNLIKDALQYGISAAFSTISHQDIVIENNDIDCDPLFRSTNRSTNGTWLADGAPYGILANYLGSCTIARNRIRNCSRPISQDGASGFQYLERNLIYADASASGFSTSNKGVGNIPGIGNGEQWWIQFEDSDPTSASFRKSLGVNFRNSSSIPTSGKWLAGTRVSSRASVATSGDVNDYISHGWLRLTTGTNHVDGTDWVLMRTTTTDTMGVAGKTWQSITSIASGLIDVGSNGLVNVALSAGQTITDISDTCKSYSLICLRNTSNAFTILHNTSKIRLNGGVDKVIQANESITFLKVASGIYQEIAGKQAHTFTNSTGVGYGTGSGGTVTQATSKSTGVTLNKPTGKITMNSAALSAGATVVFTVTNSTVLATDSLTLGFDGAGPAGQEQNYRLTWAVDSAGGAFRIVVQNVSGGSLSDAVQIRFAVLKSVNA